MGGGWHRRRRRPAAPRKGRPFLPSSQLQAVLGHAHLAALGWAVMMVMGAGYRMLPMVLPAAMPRGAWPYTGPLLTQVGAWGLFLGFLADGPWRAPLAAVSALGIVAFLGQVAWMARHRRPAPPERRRPDWSVAHVALALVSLALAMVAGLFLAFAPPSEASLRAAMAYGVFGLLGFLAQMVVGVAGRVLPLAGWLWGFSARGGAESPPSLHRASPWRLDALVLALWASGVPSLAAGLALDLHPLTATGAGCLLAATLLGAASLSLTLRRLSATARPGETREAQDCA